ncbi:cysteine-rich CWC family protein [Aquincola sp. MAHUQ-54]|uniref:Cysteine-rich CWC family protein n=1 Tax=Aquincola agrisoli TaxID=3119538 RepID=A0AAW9QC29_9BURK
MPPDTPPAAESTCPRCGGPFHCGVNDPGPCACAGVTLGPGDFAALRAQYDRCLCVGCLRALSTAEPQPATRDQRYIDPV